MMIRAKEHIEGRLREVVCNVNLDVKRSVVAVDEESLMARLRNAIVHTEEPDKDLYSEAQALLEQGAESRVLDLFCGMGGLSTGFSLFFESRMFPPISL